MDKNNVNVPSDVAIKIFNVVKEFDFAKVVRVMEFLEWQYAVPTPQNLRMRKCI